MPLLLGPDGPLEDDGGASRGSETALYEDLLAIRAKYDKWLCLNQKDFWCPEDKEKAETIGRLLGELQTDLDIKF